MNPDEGGPLEWLERLEETIALLEAMMRRLRSTAEYLKRLAGVDIYAADLDAGVDEGFRVFLDGHPELRGLILERTPGKVLRRYPQTDPVDEREYEARYEDNGFHDRDLQRLCTSGPQVLFSLEVAFLEHGGPVTARDVAVRLLGQDACGEDAGVIGRWLYNSAHVRLHCVRIDRTRKPNRYAPVRVS
jgi:hypothetical protein